MTMKELLGALEAGRVLEVFGAGTACVVCPVGSLLYRGQVGRLGGRRGPGDGPGY